MGGHLDHVTVGGITVVLYLALVSAVAYTLWSVLLAYNDVSKVAIFGFVNPLCSVILSALVLGEIKQAFNIGSLIALAFAEFDGHVVEYELEAGEQIVVDTGHLAAMTASCTMEIKSVPGVKNMLFGGEGVFNTILTGPGKVWLQTMPISNVAGVLSPYFPSSSK